MNKNNLPPGTIVKIIKDLIFDGNKQQFVDYEERFHKDNKKIYFALLKVIKNQ
jgi:hypothetical protein